ncbi:MAG: Fe-S cluster assembly protein SufD [Crenarchaeota archaeon]|nr:MAG: Fe-S cluster assembly protein SufD [Thermoproteota archaeon]RDJ33724.1 MAG: Fe-S cluster assembly protein SufD [Thermoproteota archaeon]RDJ37304.1 MAG: Fe-S cluster assembly protein SufD [Thermoproteota archaeon]RDJ39258.1 MAG: Fe-S cluster assembly protein SufD [Thermoproteota archaeon]
MSQQALSSIGSSHIEEISSSKNEPDWLKQYRKNSLSIYEGLPIETSPLYNKYTDAKKMDPEQVSLSVTSDSTVPSFLEKRLSELKDEISIIQIGTNIHKINLPDEFSSKGLVVSSIDDALKNNADLVKKALEASNSTEDKFTALNNAAFNSGIFIHIPRNFILEKPIHFVSSLSLDGISTISRNIIFADESSKATIVQELYSPKAEKQQAYLELLNTNVAANAQLDLTTLQMMDQGSVNFSTRRSDIGQDGQINWYLGLFGTILSRYRIDYYLNGTGANANDSEVVFGNKEQSFDLQSNIIHESPATEGRIIEKSILKDKSKSLFKGMIRIKEKAAKSNSYLSGRSILLDKDAKSDAIPGLEIFTNDVKATHSASVAQIDEEQIFYLGTRCLSRPEAERTIVEGFLEPLSRKMSYQVRAWIAYLIESKWDGKELMINNDEELRKFVEIEETRYNENAEIEQHYKYR